MKNLSDILAQLDILKDYFNCQNLQDLYEDLKKFKDNLQDSLAIYCHYSSYNDNISDIRDALGADWEV